jgi:Tol biopolymer transport system component
MATLVSKALGGTLGNGNSGGNALTISGDGNLVGFYSDADNLFPGNSALPGHEFDFTNMTTGTVFPVRYVPNNMGVSPVGGYGELNITPDGRYVAFSSTSVDLLPAQDNTTGADIYVQDLVGGGITVESKPTGGVQDYHSGASDISSDGRYVVFSSMDNLVGTPDSNGSSNSDVFLRDRTTGELKLVSGELDGSVQGYNNGSDCDSDNPSVTDDGRYVLFESAATNFNNVDGITDNNSASDIFVRDMVGDTIYLISTASNGTVGNSSSYEGQITPDGQYAVFSSAATNLIVGDTQNVGGIFRCDLGTREIVRVDTTSNGLVGGYRGFNAQITPDGRYVVFESRATDLVSAAGDSNAVTKIFVKDLLTGQLDMVSRTESGGVGLENSTAPQISDDGKYIVFNTVAALVTGDNNGYSDVYRVLNPLFSPTSLAASGATAGNDTIDGLYFSDAIDGLAGNDVITAHEGADSIIGGLGNDTIYGGYGDDTIRGGDQGDALYGEDSNDLISAGKGNDLLNGGAGNDTLTGGIGNDTLAGGDGVDTADYSTGTDGVTVNLTAGTGGSTVPVAGAGSGADLLSGIENIVGSAFNDVLVGNDSANVFDGGDGNDNLSGGLKADVLRGGLGNDTLAGGQGMDNLSGGAGNDVLKGALGTDLLTGGAGADHFQFGSTLDGALNIDTITDFVSGSDVIELSASIFTAYAGQVGSHVGLGSHLTYNAGSGVLAYDADGAGAGAAMTFAVLGTSSHPASLGTDFLIVA